MEIVQQVINLKDTLIPVLHPVLGARHPIRTIQYFQDFTYIRYDTEIITELNSSLLSIMNTINTVYSPSNTVKN